MTSTSNRRAGGTVGRPRDPAADASILAAARTLLGAGGLERLTVQSVAELAGVAKTTVYRRYPTKMDLAIGAIADLVREVPEAGESGAEDMSDVAFVVGEVLGDVSAQTAFLAVAGATATDPELFDRFRTECLAPVREQVRLRILHSTDREPDPHEIDFIHDVILGTMIHRRVIRQSPTDAEFAAHMTRLAGFLFGQAHPA